MIMAVVQFHEKFINYSGAARQGYDYSNVIISGRPAHGLAVSGGSEINENFACAPARAASRFRCGACFQFGEQ